MTLSSRLIPLAIAWAAGLAASGCGSLPVAPGHPDYAAKAAARTAALAAAGTPEERAAAWIGVLEEAAGEFEAMEESPDPAIEAAGRALVRIVREGVAPSLRALPPAEELPDGFADSLRSRLEEVIRALGSPGPARPLPALRETAALLREAARALGEAPE
jgi:hypothetical protein